MGHHRGRFDYFLVLDFECTCDKDLPEYPHEIIEFPVVVVEARFRRIVAEFHSYVKPVINPRLTEFCKRLTGITQEQVDAAPSLTAVITAYRAWLEETLPRGASFMFVTDGPSDMWTFMCEMAVKRDGISFPPEFFEFIDIKKSFHFKKGIKRAKLPKMMEVLGLKPEGSLHSGIDDARNIARVLIALMDLRCGFHFTAKIPYSGSRWPALHLHGTRTPPPPAPRSLKGFVGSLVAGIVFALLVGAWLVSLNSA
jgi:3'-5' exoribonuclease 1